MLNQFSRTELISCELPCCCFRYRRIYGRGISALRHWTVDLVDDDKVCPTNINRQIYAIRKTVGKYKVDVAAEYDVKITLNLQLGMRNVIFPCRFAILERLFLEMNEYPNIEIYFRVFNTFSFKKRKKAATK